jgi:uncharacterized protein (DUF1800 family)
MRTAAPAQAIALNRFGLGARPGDALPPDPQAWLLEQLPRYEPQPPAWQGLTRTPALAAAWADQQLALRRAPEAERSGLREAYVRQARTRHLATVGARLASAVQTPTPFAERLVHFWSNHFAVSVDKLPVLGLAGAFEADAIRPHVMGRFEDLLLAAVTHPAMLLYLDQAQSVGPGSAAVQRLNQRRGPADGQQPPRQRGLNENLAREILELHTLGVRGGYTQDDVTEFARALTGWTLPLAADEALAGGGRRRLAGPPGGTNSTDAADPAPLAAGLRFAPALHEPGTRTVLGRRYPPAGAAQARAILRDLAAAPATARHLARKLARHFVADEPPPALVQRLSAAYTQSGGELRAVYQALVAAPEPWAAPAAKFKTPWDWTVSALRVLRPPGGPGLPPQTALNLLNQLGQPVWRPGSPAGYDDVNAAWAAPDALLRRVEVAQRLAAVAAPGLDARALAPQVLPGVLGEDTLGAIARAESAGTALALLLVSPEFLRR